MPTSAATVEPVAWDPFNRIHPDTALTALTALPATGLACATAGLDPLAPIIGLQTADGADVRASLFRPDHPLPEDGSARRSMEISHTTEADLASGRSWPAIRPRLADYLGRLQEGAVVTVTHNAAYHLGVLAARHVPPPPVLDTMRVALALGLPARLDQLAYALGIEVADRGPSTGGADAQTPGRVWTALVPRLAAQGVTTWGNLLAVEVNRPADRAAWPDQVRAAWRRGGAAGFGAPGVEPGSAAYKAAALPLSYAPVE